MAGNTLKRRIIEISYKFKQAHLGSNLSSVDIIDEIYKKIKGKNAKFVLSAGHYGIAHYSVLEKHFGFDAEALFLKHGVHTHRDEKHGIWCSAGSLGQGLPIALGMAIANPRQQIHVLSSDGEMTEGSMWETLRIASNLRLKNLTVYVNFNGYGAYSMINEKEFIRRLFPYMDLIEMRFTSVEQLPCLKGQQAHYYILSKEDYESYIHDNP